ncbi:MAG: nuclear transport factor 2 family protein [Sandaracinus sp.]|nr:nuclear transport factor 2 family protein [Sandaracinus sp.]MCB9620195.1 nuclear transport factor 2 family protein [Sandaracinus sp.]
MPTVRLVLLLALTGPTACATCPEPAATTAPTATTPTADASDARTAVEAVLDDWHSAAAESDLPRYLGHLTPDAIFLGTDATERWTVDQLRAYAEAPFAAGRGWRMRAVRRAVVVRGDVAWVDEDLDAVNLGPARGRGVLVLDDGVWRIAHYDLAVTVPNERFEAFRAAVALPE